MPRFPLFGGATILVLASLPLRAEQSAAVQYQQPVAYPAPAYGPPQGGWRQPYGGWNNGWMPWGNRGGWGNSWFPGDTGWGNSGWGNSWGNNSWGNSWWPWGGNGWDDGYGRGWGDGSAYTDGDAAGSGAGDIDFSFTMRGRASGDMRGTGRGDGRLDGHGYGHGFNYPGGWGQYGFYPPMYPMPLPVGTTGPADDDRDGVANTSDLCPDTEAGEQVDALGCDDGARIVLRGVNFKTDSAELSDESLAILDGVSATLAANPQIKVMVAGHTDSDAEDAYNKDLSQRRAQSVVDYLTGQGVDRNNVIAKGFGEEQPIADNDSAEGKAENRRVELNRL